MAGAIINKGRESGPAEEAIQASCVEWFWNEYPQHRRMLFAVPNGGRRNKAEAARMTHTGTTAGVADLILLRYEGQCLLLECKTPKGTQSDEQIDFQYKAEERGHTYIVFRSLEEFKDIINTYL